MITAPQGAPTWAHELARRIEDRLDETRRIIPTIPYFPDPAELPDAARYWSERGTQQQTGLIGVESSGGPTLCFSDGTDWIDVLTGSAVV